MDLEINKGIGRNVEFKGLESQYLFIFCGGLLAVFVVFVILYMAGVNQWVCIGFGVAGVTREFVTAELESGAIRELKTDFEIPPRSVDMCTLRDVPPSAATARVTQEVARRVQTEERG